MKKILVTGATGFIGNYVIDALLKKGCSIVATSSDESKAARAVWLNQVQYIPFDLRRFDSSINYQHFFGNPDAVIHLAWEGLPNYKAAFHTEENLPRHYAFIKNLTENGQQDITITGTCFEYGMQEGCLSEDMPAMPANAYSIAKDSLRRQLEQLQQQNSFHFKWVRLFYMYGAGQNPNSLLSQLDRALENGDTVFNMSGGEQVRDYLPVEKVAVCITTIALQNEVEGVINCCSGVPVTVKSLVENYLKEKKQTITLNLGYYPYADYEPMRFWGSARIMKSVCQ
jgi:nucleoside-diphosphate-sugar epimerase